MVLDTESIAITGIAGRFPNCANVEELQKNLFDGVDLVTTNHGRWSHDALDTSSRLGLVKDFEYFDPGFFGINPKEANVNDPRLRKILECTYEALVDAGLNVAELRGTRVGVFMGISPNDISDLHYKGGILGRSAAIMANIVSYCFDFKGPSLAVNTACSSALFAFNHAVESMICDRCDIAIVGAVQHQVDPAESVELLKFGVLHREGICRPFDANRKGYVKSEAIAAVVLQRVPDSKRIYATIAGVGTNVEGFKRDGMAHPSHKMQKAMFEEVHRQFKIDPSLVDYVETHCTGTIVGDVEEVAAIDDFYTKGRKTPVLIGSIKSNLGHTETTSGLVSLIKVIIAIREKLIPGNINYKTPDPQMRGIIEGRLKVIDRNTPLPPGLIVVNSFGFGGANAMVILRPFTERKETINTLTHRLVHVSGRTEESLKLMLESVIKNKNNQQLLSLVDSIYYKTIDNNNHRGYAVLSKNSHYQITQSSSKRRPVWFLYAGFGSQWPGMGKDMMQIEVFRNTVKKCAEAMKPYNIDLEDILINGTQETFQNLAKTFPAIMAVSVGLTDVLASMNITPDTVIGHSLGEIGCAYADGAITAEQAVLLAFARGEATVNSNVIAGAMAAIGLSLEECSKILPEGVYIACHNSEDNVTISGPQKVVKSFLDDLTAKGIFNRSINDAIYPLHSPYLKPAAPRMYNMAKKAVPERKLRTKRWLSTAFPENEWQTEAAKYNTAEYHYHNFLNRVHFNQVLKHIPKDAIVIEVAPRALLQTILKRVVDPNVTLLPLLKPGVDNVDFFLSNIGNFYNSGGQLDLTSFYKPVEFPVSINTPMLSSLVKWDHRIKWHGLKYNAGSSFGSRIEIDMNEKENDYLEGHVADGRMILPAAGYICLVWESFAKMLETTHSKLPVVFENVKTLRPILLIPNETTTIIINIFKSTGYFEICLASDEKHVLASGRITVPEDIEKEFLDYPLIPRANQYKLKISKDEFYSNLRLRGFDYSGIFMGVQQCDIDGRSAVLKWNENWVAFMDSMVQYVLSLEATGHSLPTVFDKIIINPIEHLKSVGPNSNMTLNYDKDLNAVKCGGIEIRNIYVTNVKKRTTDIPPTLRRYKFIPNDDSQREVDPYLYSLDVAAQIAIENTSDLGVRIAEIGSDNALRYLKNTIDRVHTRKMSLTGLKSLEDKPESEFDLLIAGDDLVKDIEEYMRRSEFVFGRVQNLDFKNVEVIYRHTLKATTYALLRRLQRPPENCTIIKVSNNSFNWVKDLQVAVKKYQSPSSRIYLVNEDFNSGILGLLYTIRLEQYCPNVRVFFMRSYEKVEPFSPKSDFYITQVKKDLTVNVYQDGCWGTYRRLPLLPFQPIPYAEACLIKDSKGVKWVQKSPYQNSNNIFVHYASISKMDSLIINDRAGLDADGTEFLGLEYSGVDKNGNNVMGILPRGALSTMVKAHPQLTWNFSNKLSFEEAATIPLPYTLSYYSLFIQTYLSSKDSILVHNCTSDLSLAAIALALHKDCTVYAVADPDQCRVLRKMFPKMDESNIIESSKDSLFYKTIMRKTNRKGVSTIFNCNSFDLLKLSKKCVSKNGRFIEIGHSTIDFLTADDVMERNCSLYNINVNELFEENIDILNTIAADIDRFIKNGIAVPIQPSVFDKDNIDSALKHLEEKGYSTKCLIKIRQNGRFFSKPDSRILAYPRTYVDSSKSYIIIGGLGGFGFQLAKWLIERGATKIVLNSRSDLKSGFQASCIQKWNNQGLIVLTNTSDTSVLDGAESLINFATNLAPVGGIFNTALYAQDEFLVDVKPKDFAAVAASKSLCAQNMDIASRKLCKRLDYFVMFSSIASSMGNPVQGNYAFVNSAMERLCETRKAEGLPGLAIEWGPLADVGILARLKLKVQYLETRRQKLSSLLEVLDHFMQQNEPVVTSCVFANEEEEASEKKSLVEMIANLFGIKNTETIEDSKSLLELGMDSLLAFEIQNILQKEAGADVNINEIRNMTFEQIKQMSA